MALQRFSFKGLGSVCEVQIYLPSKENTQALKALKKKCINFVGAYQAKYTRYQKNSLTSKINFSAGSGQAVKIDNETYQLLVYAQTLYEQSNGLFDITSGVLRQAWDFKSRVLPNDQQLESLLCLIGWNKIEWDDAQIYLPNKGMEIDFGGYVKEYIADKLAQFLYQQGIHNGLINLGGDIKIIGPHPDGKPWIVGIQHPRKNKQAILKLPVYRGGIASSGDYERYMIIDGQRYCHLLNPQTGQSIQPFFCSVSVIAEDCLIAGSLTSISLLKSKSDPNWLNDIGAPHLLIDQNLQISGSLAP